MRKKGSRARPRNRQDALQRRRARIDGGVRFFSRSMVLPTSRLKFKVWFGRLECCLCRLRTPTIPFWPHTTPQIASSSSSSRTHGSQLCRDHSRVGSCMLHAGSTWVGERWHIITVARYGSEEGSKKKFFRGANRCDTLTLAACICSALPSAAQAQAQPFWPNPIDDCVHARIQTLLWSSASRLHCIASVSFRLPALPSPIMPF